MSQSVVVVGAGQAGGQFAISLRSEGFAGNITLLGAEPHLPYQRPPLSKQVLAAEMAEERVFVKPAEAYAKAAIDVRLGHHVRAIARANKTLTLNDGSQLSYDKLVLATGSRVRQLAVPGSELSNIYYLRTLDDMRALRECLRTVTRLVIVGGGYIGLEVAAVAIKQGLQVTLLEMQDQLMQRVVGQQMAEFYSAVHRAEGVLIHHGVQVSSFSGDQQVQALVCSDGTRFDADAVVVGVGIMPNTELASDAGLEVDNGIWVDENAYSSDPDILAIGDCSNHLSARFQRRMRLESVPNALAQARSAAATLCGNNKPYTEVPWFWSDQYDLKLQIVGLREGYDEIVLRGDPEQRQFMVFSLRAGELLAVESVHNPREFMVCRRLIAKNAHLQAQALADTSLALKDIATQAS